MPSFYTSAEGDLSDFSIGQILEACRCRRLTGTVQVRSGGKPGVLSLRAGHVEQAQFGFLRGAPAAQSIKRLASGTFEVHERLPPLTGASGTDAELRGTTAEVPFVELLRYCEANLLTCEVTVIIDFDRVVFTYRAGQLVSSTINGKQEPITDILRLRQAKFRIRPLPLELESAVDVDVSPGADSEVTTEPVPLLDPPELTELPLLEPDEPAAESEEPRYDTGETVRCEFDTTLRRRAAAPPRAPDSGLLFPPKPRGSLPKS